MNVLLIRMDRLGDLICTLPVDQHPALSSPHYKTTWLVSKGLEPVLDCAVPPRKAWSLSPQFSFSNLFTLVKNLRQSQIQKVILFYGPWWVSLACLLAGISERFSPKSRWHQLLFFNRTLKQNRSLSEKHEADYNWDLLHWALTGEPKAPMPTPILQLQSSDPLPSQLPRDYVVLHPGMGGSALNWPTQNYLTLADKLLAAGHHLVITGTSADAPWLKDIETKLRDREGVFWQVGQFSLKTLIQVLANSRATIAPSTGVLHLAASTGIKTIGLYSPIKVQTPVRWGPRGTDSIALKPDVTCPASKRCVGETCPEFFCLNKIDPEHVLRLIPNL